MRMSKASQVPEVGDKNMVIVLNHPSWWDPMICIHLSQYFPDHAHYAPIDAEALNNLKFFTRLGFFGVERDTLGGARTFLQTGLAILEKPRSAIWITGQGHFTDPRQRPIRLYPGTGHLVEKASNIVVVPLALEYPFWTERTPEALIRFGSPLSPEANEAMSPKDRTSLISKALEETMDELAREACQQDSGLFIELISGRTGIGGIFDLWRRILAYLRCRRFRSEHISTEGE